MKAVNVILLLMLLSMKTFLFAQTSENESSGGNDTFNGTSVININETSLFTGNVDHYVFGSDKIDYWKIPHGSSGNITVAIKGLYCWFRFLEGTDAVTAPTAVVVAPIGMNDASGYYYGGYDNGSVYGSTYTFAMDASKYYYICVQTQTNIASYTIQIGGVATLPVELTSFTASAVNNKVNLNWQTATEVNNYGFEILRSAQNEKWETVGFVKGSGNSNSPKEYSYTDTPTGGTEYSYRLKQIDIDGAYEYSDVVEVTLAAPTNFAVEQNFPNPFNPTTTIKYQVPSVSNVSLKVFDILGREAATLVNEQKAPGKYEVKFDGNNLSSGIYFYKLQAGDFTQTKKLILMK